MVHKHYKQIIILFSAGVLALSSASVSASGFQLLEQNVTNLGTAYAGTAALAEDASIGYYNSAGLTRLGEEQIVFSLVGIVPNGRFRSDNATPTLPATPVPAVNPIFFIPSVGALPNLAPGTARSRPVSFVPAGHYAIRLSDCAVFGLSVTAPFGLKTKYKNDSIARYLGTRGEIRTYDISPSIGIALGHGISVGGGLDILHTLARFDNRVGFGVVERDGLFENTVSRWSLAGHVGFLFEFDECTRLGVQYRSGFKVKGHGQSRTELPIFARFPEIGLFQTQGVRAGLRFPGSVVASWYSDINDCWAFMADIQYTNWKRFNKVTARFDDNSQLILKFNFKDTMRYALGTSYRFSECWLGRFGVAFDKSPVRHAAQRTLLIADSDRYWLALGAQYRITECLTMEMGYAHIFFEKSRIHQGPPSVLNSRLARPFQSVDGRYKSHADLLGIQFTWELA